MLEEATHLMNILRIIDKKMFSETYCGSTGFLEPPPPANTSSF